MSYTALSKAVSSVRGRALVCGRLAADGGATGKADARAGADCLTGVPLGRGDALRVALTGLVATLAVTAGLTTAPGALPGVGPAEQPVSTASAAATAGMAAGRATARRRAPRPSLP
jgi:hypothetical protein